jgi:hypothetical protein
MDNKSVTPGSLPVKRDGWPGLNGRTAVVTGVQFVSPTPTRDEAGRAVDVEVDACSSQWWPTAS